MGRDTTLSTSRARRLRSRGRGRDKPAAGIGVVVVELLEAVQRLPVTTPGRSAVMTASSRVADAIEPLSVKEAADLLKVDPKTIRHWLEIGLLKKATGISLTKRLDPIALAKVRSLISELRTSGKQRGFTSALKAALEDQAMIDSDDVQKGLSEMKSGQRSRWTEREDGTWGPASQVNGA